MRLFSPAKVSSNQALLSGLAVWVLAGPAVRKLSGLALWAQAGPAVRQLSGPAVWTPTGPAGAGGGLRSGHGVSDHVLLAGNVPDVAGVFCCVGQVAALPQRPGVRGPSQSECDGLVVCEYRELTSIKHVPEVPDPGCAGQKLPVESRVALLCWVELL